MALKKQQHPMPPVVRAVREPERTPEQIIAAEQNARRIAQRFGVDPDLSPKERTLAVMRAVGRAK